MKNEILVVPDVHCEPGLSTEHLTWAGNLAVYRQPKTIVILGDFCDLGSLCYYDKGSIASEGRRLVDDIQACKEGIEAFMKPINDYNYRKTTNAYRPSIVLTVGNHENRLTRAGNTYPEYHGHLSIDMLGYKDAGWKVIPFNKPYQQDGILFQHHFTAGIMGRPMSREYHAAGLIKQGFESSICGHTHLFDMAVRTSGSGKRVIGLVAGCYFQNDHGFTSENDRYWRGLVYLRDVHQGSFWPEMLSMEYLKRRFG